MGLCKYSSKASQLLGQGCSLLLALLCPPPSWQPAITGRAPSFSPRQSLAWVYLESMHTSPTLTKAIQPSGLSPLSVAQMPFQILHVYAQTRYMPSYVLYAVSKLCTLMHLALLNSRKQLHARKFTTTASQYTSSTSTAILTARLRSCHSFGCPFDVLQVSTFKSRCRAVTA